MLCTLPDPRQGIGIEADIERARRGDRPAADVDLVVIGAGDRAAIDQDVDGRVGIELKALRRRQDSRPADRARSMIPPVELIPSPLSVPTPARVAPAKVDPLVQRTIEDQSARGHGRVDGSRPVPRLPTPVPHRPNW